MTKIKTTPLGVFPADGVPVDIVVKEVIQVAYEHFKNKGIPTVIAIVRDIVRSEPAGVLIFVPVNIYNEQLKQLAEKLKSVYVEYHNADR